MREDDVGVEEKRMGVEEKRMGVGEKRRKRKEKKKKEEGKRKRREDRPRGRKEMSPEEVRPGYVFKVKRGQNRGSQKWFEFENGRVQLERENTPVGSGEEMAVRQIWLKSQKEIKTKVK
jgi:hypothetical protein